ncbi:MAG: hypothetical protein M5U27_00610 [Gaiella sp.]|nr:hypothetical protein [Gaiella sp.]
MLEPYTPEIRQELATARIASLHRSAGPVPAGALRRTAGSALVRLGLRLGYDGRVPPSLAPELGNSVGAGLQPGTHAVSLVPARAPRPAWRMPFTIEGEVERELAAPFGVKSARLKPGHQSGISRNGISRRLA